MVNVVGQDPDAHVFYEVDWNSWLTARGFLAADIVSITWAVESPLVKTHQTLTGAVARVYIRGVPRDRKDHEVTCTIAMPEPSAGVGEVTDDFTFAIRANEK